MLYGLKKHAQMRRSDGSRRLCWTVCCCLLCNSAKGGNTVNESKSSVSRNESDQSRLEKHLKFEKVTLYVKVWFAGQF